MPPPAGRGVAPCVPRSEIDAARGDRPSREGVAHVLVEAAQELVAAMQQRHLAAEPGEDPGELDGDVAAADDEDPLGLASRGGRPRST